MDLNKLGQLVAVLLFVAPASIVAQEWPPCDVNLLQNPGCDEPLDGGEIPGWTPVGSSWTCQAPNLAPWLGPGTFSAGQGDVAELYQDVDVRAYTSPNALGLMFSGALRTLDENPSDLVRIIFEFRGPGGTIQGSFDTGELSPTTGWETVITCCNGPYFPTEVVRVRLISTRQSAQGNNGYFDLLSVSSTCPAPVEALSWGLIKTIYR